MRCVGGTGAGPLCVGCFSAGIVSVGPETCEPTLWLGGVSVFAAGGSGTRAAGTFCDGGGAGGGVGGVIAGGGLFCEGGDCFAPFCVGFRSCSSSSIRFSSASSARRRISSSNLARSFESLDVRSSDFMGFPHVRRSVLCGFGQCNCEAIYPKRLRMSTKPAETLRCARQWVIRDTSCFHRLIFLSSPSSTGPPRERKSR